MDANLNLNNRRRVNRRRTTPTLPVDAVCELCRDSWRAGAFMQAVARPPCAGAAAARLAVASYPRRLRGLAAPLRAGDCGAGGRARSPLALTQAIFGRGGGAARSPASARLGGLGGAGLLEKPSFTFEREARVEIRLSPQYKVRRDFFSATALRLRSRSALRPSRCGIWLPAQGANAASGREQRCVCEVRIAADALRAP